MIENVEQLKKIEEDYTLWKEKVDYGNLCSGSKARLGQRQEGAQE